VIDGDTQASTTALKVCDLDGKKISVLFLAVVFKQRIKERQQHGVLSLPVFVLPRLSMPLQQGAITGVLNGKRHRISVFLTLDRRKTVGNTASGDAVVFAQDTLQ